MINEVLVRRANDSDSESIRRLVTKVSTEFGLTGADYDDSDLVRVASNYSAGGGWFEVLERDEDLLGTIGMFALSPDELELRKMYFNPALRGCGLGKALLHRNLLQAQQAGFTRVSLETASVLTTAVALYQRFGFRQVTRKGGCDTGCDQAWVLKLADYQPDSAHMEVLSER